MTLLDKFVMFHNDFLYYVGIIAEDRYLSSNEILINLTLALILSVGYLYFISPYLLKRVDKIKMSDEQVFYSFGVVNITFLTIVYFEQMYTFLAITILLEGVLYIIFTDKKFVNVKEFITGFF